MHLSSTFVPLSCVEMLPLMDMDSTVQDDAFLLSKEGLDSACQGNYILIVDDDPAILMLVSKMVLHLGLRPKTAVDGLDALDVMDKYPCRLVITDDEMPAMDGCQLAEQIQKKHLGTPVIIMSGIQEGERLNALVTSGLVAGLLPKPFNLNTLRNTIKTVTGRRTDRCAC
jgi:two-component system, NarL family, capsular synthesis sensor histidine kinase RcsC